MAVTCDLSLVSWLPPSQKQRGLTLSLVVQFPKRPKSSQKLDVDKSRHMSVFWLQYKRIVIPWHPTLSLALCDCCYDATESTLSKSLISKTTTTIEESHRVFVFFFRNLQKICSSNWEWKQKRKRRTSETLNQRRRIVSIARLQGRGADVCSSTNLGSSVSLIKASWLKNENDLRFQVSTFGVFWCCL